MAGLLYGLVAGLARWGLWPARLPWLPWACGLAMAAALAYGWLAGAGVPVQRACLMLAVVLLWRLRFRHLGATLPLLLALVAVLLVEPLAALLPGFWLSFTAVATLVYWLQCPARGWRPWQAWTRAQWVIAIGLLPVLLATGLPVSLSAPLANLVAVPWVSLAVLPLALLGTLLLRAGRGRGGLAMAGGWPAGWAVPAAGAGGAAAPMGGAGPAIRGLAIGEPWALCWFCCPVVCRCAVVGRGACCWPCGCPENQVPHGQVEVWQLDVGQGLAVLLRTATIGLLYDAGPARGESDLGERVVLHRRCASWGWAAWTRW